MNIRHRLPLLISIAFLTLILSAPSLCADTTLVEISVVDLFKAGYPESAERSPSPRTALVLSGGGARGIAQIGLLKAIEEHEIEIDLIVGTSMGGILGGLWAAGFTADSLAGLARSVDWGGFFSDRPRRSNLFLTQKEEGEKNLLTLRFDGLKPTIPTALTAGQKLTSLLNRLSMETNYRSQHDFDKLDIPLRVCAVDILTGTPVVIKSGNLADALRATMAVPLAFTPLEMDSMMLMDGGLLMPIPVEVARQEGADFVIAGNTTSGLLGRDQISDPIDIANQTTTIMQLAARESELADADFVIKPELDDQVATDFTGIDDLIEAGYVAAMRMMPEIKAALSEVSVVAVDTTAICVDTVVVPAALEMQSQIDNLRSFSIFERNIPISLLRETARELIMSGAASRVLISNSYESGASVLRFHADVFRPDAGLKVVGNETLADSRIRSALDTVKIGTRPLHGLKTAVNALEQVYIENGYDLMAVDSIKYDLLTNNNNIYVSEGLIHRIMVIGNERTKGWVIKRNFTLKVGEPFNLGKAEEGMSNIFSTGLFERVNFDIENDSGRVIVWIDVREKDYFLIRYGAHYHDHYHAENYLDFADANILGFSNELFFRVMYGEVRKYYSVHLKADRIFETYLTYHLKLYHNRLKRDRYVDNKSIGVDRERRTGAHLTFGQQIARFGTLTAEARAEQVRVDLPGQAGVMHRNIRSLIFRSRVDNMDEYPFPDHGIAAHMYVELASDILGGEDRFNKAYFELRAQVPLSSRLGLQPEFALGLSDANLPRFEKFFIGGNRTLYGYRFEALEGDNVFRGNLGLRVELPFRFYLTGRYDVGDVWTSIEELNFENLRHAFGFGLDYDSPFGPISVSYGRAENKYDRVYIDVGYNF